jgi:hypothetical protein
MTIEARLKLFGKVLSQSIVPVGKQFNAIVEEEAFGFWTWDERKTRLDVLDDNSVSVTTEWESQRKKREKTGQSTPSVILHGDQINGVKIPHSVIPGAKYELSWRPSSRK